MINKRKRTLLFGVLAAVVAAMMLILFYRFGWKYTGFKMVSDPNVINIERVFEDKGEIIIEGSSALKIGSFEGANTFYKDGVLYVGIRYSIFGKDNKFKFKYKETEGLVHRVVLRRLDTYKTVWLRPWEENKDYENTDG